MGERPMVGVDLGGTSLIVAVVGPEGEVLGSAKRKTRADLGAEQVIRRIASTIAEALDDANLSAEKVGGVGVGVPGPLDPHSGIVRCCPNLGPSWNNLPVAQILGDLVGLKVAIENDVNAGAVGEFTYGAGRGVHDMVAIFVGTGVGGGLVLDGKLRSGARNSAGEVGHMIVLADGPMCGCGQRGHLEALASRSAIDRDIRAAIRGGRSSVVTKDVDPSSDKPITSSVIEAAYDAGDSVVVEAVSRAQYYLALLVASCVNLLDPEVVVVGGGLVQRMGERYVQPVAELARQHYINQVEVEAIRVLPAALGDYSGAIGAAVLARHCWT